MRKYNLRGAAVGLAAVAFCTGITVSSSSAAVFIGSSGGLSASVSFTTDGNDLVVKLDNTAGAESTLSPSSLLTAVYFSIGTTSSFSSGDVDSHGDVWNYVTTGKGNNQTGSWQLDNSADVGAYWEAKGGLSKTPNNQNFGISSTGLGIFDQNGNLTTGTPGPLDGPPWGISAGTPADVQAMQGNSPVVASEIVFRLKGLGDLLSSISDVGFQYGTATSEPYINGTPEVVVPEPTTMIAGALLLLPFGASTLRFFRKNKGS